MKIEINEFRNWQHSLTIKILLLSVLGIFLLIPLEMIKSIIQERQKNYEEVKKEIAYQWAGNQTISGPVLNIPVKNYPVKQDGEPYVTIYHLMPDQLNVSGGIQTEKRNRSIYEAVVYTASMNISGTFDLSLVKSPQNGEILWEESYYSIGITDNRGLKGNVELTVDSSRIEAIPGLRDSELFTSGITFISDMRGKTGILPFDLNLTLSGSEGMSFSPAGRNTNVSLTSNWNSPGFMGNFLPEERSIDDKGFKADWRITNLNRNFPQIWTGNAYSVTNDSFGVDFVITVDHYQKSLRSAKYGILFIALSFLALIFAEFTLKENIHVFQYLLVASGLVLFFSLLNALSEQIGFNLAYLAASISTILMIFLFLRKVLGKMLPVLMVTGLLIILYIFIFILLTLNDYAYLAGNIGLFILLSLTMYLSIKFRIFSSEKSDPQI